MQFIRNSYTKSITFLKHIEFKFVRSEHAIIIIPALIIFLVVLFYVPYLFSNKDLRFQIEQKISAQTKGNLEIYGDVKIALLPTPSITFNNAILENYVIDKRNYSVYIKQGKVKLSFWASIIGRFLMKEVIISDAIIASYSADNPPDKRLDGILEMSAELAKNKSEIRNKTGFGGNLFAIRKLDLSKVDLGDMPKISVINSKWFSYSKIGNKKQIDDINVYLEFSDKKIFGEGKFSNQGIVNNFKLDFKTKSQENDSVLEIFSSYANVKIVGTFNPKNKDTNLSFGQRFKGVIEGEIFNLKDFYRSYITSKGLIYDKINPATRSVKMKATLVANGGEVEVNSIIISSNLLNGRGRVNLDFSTDITLLDVDLAFENIDLDEIWMNEKNSSQNKKNNQQSEEIAQDLDKENHNISLDVTKDLRDFDLTLELKVSRVKYLGEEIKKVDLFATVSKQGSVLIMPLKLELPGGGKFRINGVLENRNSPRFVGKIDADGDKLDNILRWLRFESQNLKYESLANYRFYSDLMLMPNSTVLNNFYLNIGGGKGEILGEVKIDYRGNSSNIISNFEVRDINVDDYFLTSGKNIYLSPGSLLKKLLWLNSVNSKHDFTLLFDKLRYKNLIFQNEVLKVRFGKGYFEIDNFKLHNDDFDLQTSLALDINAATPKFDLSIKSENFNYISVNKTVLDDAQQMAQDSFSQETSVRKLTAFDQFLALPSFEGFDGAISIDLASSDFDGFAMQNVKIDAKLRDGVVDFGNFSGDVYGGSMIYKGGIGMKFDKSVSGNFFFNKVRLRPLFSDLFGLKNVDGIANISSSFASYGSSRRDFIKNVNSDSKFSAGLIEIKGYGLNDLIKKMFNLQYYRNDLKDLTKILFNDKTSTVIKQAVGAVSISKGGDNKFKADFSSTALNGVFSGEINLEQNSINALANVIFLTGNRQKQIPINIATNLNGKFDNILQNTNLDQAQQYIDAANQQYDLSGNANLQFKEIEQIEVPQEALQKIDKKITAQEAGAPEYIQNQLDMIQVEKQKFVSDPALKKPVQGFEENQQIENNDFK